MARRSTCATFASLAFLAVAGVAFPIGCGSSGSVVFGLTSELPPGASFTSLDATVIVNGDVVIERTFDGANLRFPIELPVDDVADQGDVSLTLVAKQGERPLLTRSASTLGQAGRRLLYEVKLESECVDVTCDDASTCVEGECVDPFDDALPDYYPGWAGGSGGGRCEPGGDPEVIVGEGQADYHTVDEGEVLQVEAGPQGGYHVWIAARMKNLSQSGSLIDVSGRFPALGYEPQPITVIFTFDPDEGGYCKVYGLRFRIDDEEHPVEALLGQELEVTVTVTDPDADTASSTRTIVLSDDFI